VFSAMAWLGFSCGKTAVYFNLGFVFCWFGAEIRHNDDKATGRY